MNSPRLQHTWPDQECRLLTVIGPGGVGKNLPLAVEAARARVGGFAHGVWFVDLAPVATADLAPGIILRVLDAPDRGATTLSAVAELSARQGTMLLVLDNASTPGTQPICGLRRCTLAPGLKLLLTSRARARICARSGRSRWAGLHTPPVQELLEPADELPCCPPASPLPSGVGDV